MTPLPRWTRPVLAAAAIAAAAAFGPPAADAAPTRTADTSTYTSASYLESALGLPAKPKHVIESVTYDRFQWLLQQDGKFAFLIGDPATDPTFPSRAQAVESAASDAGVKRVYWFNPNLSGNAKLGDVVQPNLDIRRPAGITALAPAKADVYGTAWLNLVGQYLGNGIKATPLNQNASNASVTAAPDASVVNDYGSAAGYSTEVGDTSGGALYDYGSTGTAPADVADSVFFLYDRNEQVTPAGSATARSSKVLAWVNLTDKASAAAALTDVAAAIATCGAANIAAIDEFAWWKASNNAKQATQAPNDYQGSGVPNLTDADGSAANGGWRVHQVTYPELVHVLQTERSKEAVILFGGTWCPNTRPVLPAINRDAQANDVAVINFDTILDGGVIGGGISGTNSGTNPLQSRGPAANGGFDNANPSFLYGELVSRYLSNLKTEYKPDAANRITYYPGGDTTKALQSQPRLQVPYLFGYKGTTGTGGIVRQWIHDKGTTDAQGRPDYVEYMSQWWFTNPQAGQLGVTPANLPREAPIWTTINSQLASFTWRTDPETVRVNSGTDADAARFLVPADKAKLTYSPAAPATATDVSVASDPAAGPIAISPDALSAALASLGSATPANYAAARTDLIAAKAGGAPAQRISDLETVVAAWGVEQQRKTRVNTIWGTAAAPGSVAGGAAALRAAEVFFAGLPDKGGATTPGTTDPGTTTPVTTDPGTTDPAPAGGTLPQVASQPAPATRPATPAAVSTKGRVRQIAGRFAKAPTSRSRGRYAVRITTPSGRPAATGRVTVTLRKGKTKRTLRGTLRKGVVTLAVPKLAKGTWKVAVAWAGDATYAGEATSGRVKVRK